jgi:hypothetical protein
MAKKKEIEEIKQEEVILPAQSVEIEIQDAKKEEREALKKKIDDYLNGKVQLEPQDYKLAFDLL